MTTTLPPESPVDPAEEPGVGAEESGKRRGITFEVIAMLAFLLALGAALLAVFSLALSARSIEESRRNPASTGGSDAVSVVLAEFTITPDPLTVPAGGSLAVSNGGSVAHDLVVEGIATPELAAGEDAVLDLSALEPGTYTMYCQIAGHRESGMEGDLTVQ